VHHVLTALQLVDVAHIPLSVGARPVSTLDRDCAFLTTTAWPALMRMVTHHYGDLQGALQHLVNYRAETEMHRQTIRAMSNRSPLTPEQLGVTLLTNEHTEQHS
jgi:hypothetical protein